MPGYSEIAGSCKTDELAKKDTLCPNFIRLGMSWGYVTI